MTMTMVKRFVVSMVMVAVLAFGSIAPAMADFPGGFTPIASLPPFPDPGSCILGPCTFTLYTDLNEAISMYNEIQKGRMMLYNLRDAGLGGIGGAGVLDPTGANLLRQVQVFVGEVAPTQQGLACKAMVGANGGANTTDLQNLFTFMQTNGFSGVASTQVAGTAVQEVAGKVEAQNECAGAEATAGSANVAQTYTNLGEEFDTNGPADAGWLL
jgi:hypothetical protein